MWASNGYSWQGQTLFLGWRRRLCIFSRLAGYKCPTIACRPKCTCSFAMFHNNGPRFVIINCPCGWAWRCQEMFIKFKFASSHFFITWAFVLGLVFALRQCRLHIQQPINLNNFHNLLLWSILEQKPCRQQHCFAFY
jgi:hypothetical protein